MNTRRVAEWHKQEGDKWTKQLRACQQEEGSLRLEIEFARNKILYMQDRLASLPIEIAVARQKISYHAAEAQRLHDVAKLQEQIKRQRKKIAALEKDSYDA